MDDWKCIFYNELERQGVIELNEDGKGMFK
jgi:hypothetical protein